jgi:hypothetical protein
MKSHPVLPAITLVISMRRLGSMLRSQFPHEAGGRPHSIAASLMFQPIRWRTSARRAANVESSTVHPPLAVDCSVMVMAADYGIYARCG